MEKDVKDFIRQQATLAGLDPDEGERILAETIDMPATTRETRLALKHLIEHAESDQVMDWLREHKPLLSALNALLLHLAKEHNDFEFWWALTIAGLFVGLRQQEGAQDGKVSDQ